jgi:hypothetical protein
LLWRLAAAEPAGATGADPLSSPKEGENSWERMKLEPEAATRSWRFWFRSSRFFSTKSTTE